MPLGNYSFYTSGVRILLENGDILRRNDVIKGFPCEYGDDGFDECLGTARDVQVRDGNTHSTPVKELIEGKPANGENYSVKLWH